MYSTHALQPPYRQPHEGLILGQWFMMNFSFFKQLKFNILKSEK